MTWIIFPFQHVKSSRVPIARLFLRTRILSAVRDELKIWKRLSGIHGGFLLEAGITRCFKDVRTKERGRVTCAAYIASCWVNTVAGSCRGNRKEEQDSSGAEVVCLMCRSPPLSCISHATAAYNGPLKYFLIELKVLFLRSINLR